MTRAKTISAKRLSAPHAADCETPAHGLRHLTGAERLAGLGFRCWLTGYQTGAIDCWEVAWNTYALELGPQAARGAIRDLSCWVRAVRGEAQRSIEVCPTTCEQFGHDECLAVSMIAAAQHNCPAIKACAFALLGSQHCEQALASAARFAAALKDNHLVLNPDPIVQPLARDAKRLDQAVH